MMNYEAWRISFQSSEQAAKAAYTEAVALRQQLAECQAALALRAEVLK